jgi:DNA-binding NarL/FixJ family response regulator/TolA-binding protein
MASSEKASSEKDSSEKIRILLADEDALRRDGLAAVLQASAQHEIVAQCPDGEAALNQIRRLRPDIAVVDLNLPKLHGIELVRSIRSEALGTKIVILSGTSDDDIIREVVRAGGDAYLLKNGPARHLIDAISYVRDGGQYFSPQLRRDGLDRRLLEEKPRPASEAFDPKTTQQSRDGGHPKDNQQMREDVGDERSGSARSATRDGSRYGRPRRSAGRGANRFSDPQRLRERLREEDAESENLDDRDYEILSMMADGIRPILDRLDEIEDRVQEMERGDTPVPGNVRGWLTREIADTLGSSAGGAKDVALSRTINDLEARLPNMIEQAVTARFHNMATKLQQEIEETHVRTLETFVRNIQVKLVQRVSALENDMSKQAEAMRQLQEYSMRTEDNLSRLISGVDKLAQELPRRLAAPASRIVEETPEPEITASTSEPRPRQVRRNKSGFSPKLFWTVVAGLIVIGTGISQAPRFFHADRQGSTGNPAGSATANRSVSPAVPAPSLNADTKTKMQAAQQYTDSKDYSTAEDIYKQILKTEPNNVEAMKALASVLYREDKLEESAAILDKLPKTN